MKVLHIQLLPLLSGVQRVSLNEILSLRDKFNYTVVCSSEGALTEELDKNNINYKTISSLVREISFFKDVKAIIELYCHIYSSSYDVVHTHSSKTGFIGRVTAKIAGVKNVIHTVHGFAFPSAKSKIQYFIFFSMEYIAKFFTNKLIVLNDVDYNYAINKLNYKKENVEVLVNGVDVNYFSYSLRDNRKEVKFLMVGRLWEQKDPITLLNAVLKLKGLGSFKIDIIGDGELYNRCEVFIEENELGGIIKLHGWQKNVKEFLSDSDVFILPSRWEGMPLAILEAMSSGLPCIVTDIPGNNHLVHNNINGFLFNCGDDEMLSMKMRLFIDNYPLIDSMSYQARNMAISQYSLNSRNEKIVEMYEKYS